MTETKAMELPSFAMERGDQADDVRRAHITWNARNGEGTVTLRFKPTIGSTCGKIILRDPATALQKEEVIVDLMQESAGNLQKLLGILQDDALIEVEWPGRRTFHGEKDRKARFVFLLRRNGSDRQPLVAEHHELDGEVRDLGKEAEPLEFLRQSLGRALQQFLKGIGKP